MTWFGWLLVAYWALNALLYVWLVGRSIKYTPGGAVFAIVLYSLLTWGVIAVGTNTP